MQPTLYDFDAALRQRLEPIFGTLGEVARHKLLYAVHRLAIAKTNEPAFSSICRAWKMGPVFLDLHNSPNRKGDPAALSSTENGYCDWVARILGAQSGRSLAARSHCRYPEWRYARRFPVNNEITLAAIRAALDAVRPITTDTQ
jgi:uncharacterized phage-associated protein